MVTTKPLQPSLLASVEEGPAPSPGGGLASDPLVDEAQQQRRRHMALILCRNGVNAASWELANRLAVSWGFSCSALGVDRPADPDGERRRVVVRHG